MNNRIPVLLLILLIALVGSTLLPTSASAQKTKQTISFKALNLSLIAEPRIVTACADQATPPVVQLSAKGILPEGRSVLYAWRASAGSITGEGSEVSWDLSGLRPGYYKAYVDIDTGDVDNQCEAFSSATVLVDSCPPVVRMCPVINISYPENPALDKPLQFSATLSGGLPKIDPKYNWTVSAGTIISGQGRNSIIVDTKGLAGQPVTATLSLTGFGIECAQASVVQLPVPVAACRKFDEFPDLARDDEKARLDNLAIELMNDPASTGYIVVHPAQRDGLGSARNRANRVTNYLINSRGIDSGRLVTQIGPTGSQLTVELWTCPKGGKPPVH